MKKNRLLFLPLLALPLCSCQSLNKTAYVTLLGNGKYAEAIKTVAEKTGLKSNMALSRTPGNYKEDYYVLDKDPIIHDDIGNFPSSTILKNTEILIFAYDVADVLSSKQNEEYREEEQDKDYALFDYYLELTYEDLQEKTSACVVSLGLYEDGDSIYRGYLEKFNNLLYDKAVKYNMRFISTLFLGKYTIDGKISTAGIDILNDLILAQYDE